MSRARRLPDEAILRQLLNMNPPEHGEYRRVVNQRFTPRSVQQLQDQIEQDHDRGA